MGVWYCTRSDVAGALDYRETARLNVQIDRAVEAASRSVESLTRRRFYPWTGTKYFDWPNLSYAQTWRLWFDLPDQLITATTVTSGGTVVGASDFFAEPVNFGPPFDRIEIDRASASAWTAGSTPQRSISILGVWGYDNVTETTTTTAEALDASETGIDVASSANIGVGSLLLIDAERVTVTAMSLLDTGADTAGSVAAQNNVVTLPVDNGALFSVGETITVDSERMNIVDINGNNLTVRRGWDGTVLAAHNSAVSVYAPRTLTVRRGELGTTAATHSTSATVSRQVYPGLIHTLTVAEASNFLLSEASGYGSQTGAGESGRGASGGGLKILRDQVKARYGRLRTAAV